MNRLGGTWEQKFMRRQKLIAPGWRFEAMIFGGHLIRLVERVRPSHPDRMSVSTNRVMSLVDIDRNLWPGRDGISEGVPGYRIISDEVIKATVEGKSSIPVTTNHLGAGSDQYFPLDDQHKNECVAGIHRDAAYRSGDESEDLYRGRLPPRRCVR